MHDKFLFAFQMYKSYFVGIIRDANRRVESKSIHISDPTAYIRQLRHVPFHLLPIPHTELWSWKVPTARRHENEKTSERVAWNFVSLYGGRLQKLDVFVSPIDDPARVAAFLSDILPNVRKVSSTVMPYRAAEMPVVGPKWDEVERLISVFAAVRRQEAGLRKEILGAPFLGTNAL